MSLYACEHHDDQQGMYLHCLTCVSVGHRGQYDAFAPDATTVEIRCSCECHGKGTLVARLKLALPLPWRAT